MNIYNRLSIKKYLALTIVFSINCSASENSTLENLFKNGLVKIDAKIDKQSLIFTVKNNSNQDLLINDDFCYFDKLRTTLLSEPEMKQRKDYFSSDMSHPQNRMVKLKAHGQVKCSNIYFENEQPDINNPGKGLVVWNANFFIGDYKGGYLNKRMSGVVPVAFPIGISDLEPNLEMDKASLSRYEQRNSLGIKGD